MSESALCSHLHPLAEVQLMLNDSAPTFCPHRLPRDCSTCSFSTDRRYTKSDILIRYGYGNNR
jgi:hypothetical protein